MSSKFSLTAICTALLFSGCANPMRKVEAPGSSLALSPAVAAEPASMGESIQKLNHLRAVYYEAIREQSGLSQNATTGLVWLGSLIVGMATGKVHSDAILGASLIGGTTYGLSQTQLDARRIDIWQAGMEALDCAKEATLPMNLGSEARLSLQNVHAELVTQRAAATQAIAAVRKAAAAGKGMAAAPSAVQAADQAEQDVAQALATQAAVAALLDASRGGELSAAVDRIQTGVTKAMKDIAVGPQAVRQLVAGVGGFADMLAPGTGVGTLFTSALGKYNKASAPKAGDASQSSELTSLDDKVKALSAKMDSLEAAQVIARGLLREVNQSQISQALKKCGVTAASTAMLLKPATIPFEAGKAASKGFQIVGGTPPYEVEALDSLPDSLSQVFRGGLSDRAQIKATAEVSEGTYRFLVTDSGASKRSEQLVVEVTAAGAAKAKGEAATDPAQADAAKVSADWAALLAALTKPGFKMQVGSTQLTVTSAVQAGSGLLVKLSCSKANAGLDLLDVREQVAAADPAARDRLQAAKALNKNLEQIDLSANKPCVKV